MSYDSIIQEAIAHGTAVGQVSLAEYIKKSYKDELSPELERFLQKVCDNAYNDIGNNMQKPAEDVALEVADIVTKVH